MNDLLVINLEFVFFNGYFLDVVVVLEFNEFYLFSVFMNFLIESFFEELMIMYDFVVMFFGMLMVCVVFIFINIIFLLDILMYYIYE